MTSDFHRPIKIDFSFLCPNKTHHIPGSGKEENRRRRCDCVLNGFAKEAGCTVLVIDHPQGTCSP